jgi:hypothetical protein
VLSPSKSGKNVKEWIYCLEWAIPQCVYTHTHMHISLYIFQKMYVTSIYNLNLLIKNKDGKQNITATIENSM